MSAVHVGLTAPFLSTFPQEEGGQISVVADYENGSFLVRDLGGTKYTLQRTFIDCGYDFEIAPGVWRHETDPTVLGKLREDLKNIKSCVGCDVQGLAEEMVQICRILARNAAVRSLEACLKSGE